jgi:hypothetical protein
MRPRVQGPGTLTGPASSSREAETGVARDARDVAASPSAAASVFDTSTRKTAPAPLVKRPDLRGAFRYGRGVNRTAFFVSRFAIPFRNSPPKRSRPAFWGRRSVAFGAVAAALVIGCGSEEGEKAPPETEETTGGRFRGESLPEPLRPEASCEVVVETPELLRGEHVPEGTPLEYNSNPPSSGAHYGFWANYEEFSSPVPRGYLLHSLEHGAIALLYKCDDAGGCSEIVAQLRQVREAIPSDPRCSGDVRVRVIIAPDPELDVPVAAAAWGWTYKAACVDLPTLTEFARDRYAQGPENTCAPGRSSF